MVELKRSIVLVQQESRHNGLHVFLSSFSLRVEACLLNEEFLWEYTDEAFLACKMVLHRVVL